MSSRQPFFRYSLRSLLLLVAVVAVACLWYRAHRAFQRSPSKSHMEGGYRGTGDPQHLRTRIYRDHDGRLVAIFLLAFDELDVNGPRYQLAHGYTATDGGWLTLDGAPIEPHAKPRVFANDPLGRVVELKLTPSQADDLAGRQSAAEIEVFYRDVVEPEFFQISGLTSAKGREGPWVYRLKGGELYKVVTYADGLRHGEMRTFYRSGKVKSEQFFDRGRPTGEWSLFSPEGKVLAIVDQMHVAGGNRGAGGSSREIVRVPKSKFHVYQWATEIDDKNGYRLFVDGAELKMPQ